MKGHIRSKTIKQLQCLAHKNQLGYIYLDSERINIMYYKKALLPNLNLKKFVTTLGK